jgi:hypothetical protein
MYGWAQFNNADPAARQKDIAADVKPMPKRA